MNYEEYASLTPEARERLSLEAVGVNTHLMAQREEVTFMCPIDPQERNECEGCQ